MTNFELLKLIILSKDKKALWAAWKIFCLQNYHKVGYYIERMFEQKIRMEKKRTYCPLFTTIGINAEAQTVHHEM